MAKYRTFWRRFWAGFIDGLVLLPLTFLNFFLSSPERSPAILILWAITWYSAYWLYSVLMPARYGQTLGKMVTRVKVLDLSEERIPTFQQAFVRDIGYIVLNVASLAYFIYLVVTQQYVVRGAEATSLPGQILS